MTKRMRIAGGKAAVWDDGSDTDPFDTPLSHLSRVKFHSDLDYIKVIDEQVVTVNFAAQVGPGYTGSYTMFSHGRGGIPLVFAACTLGGVSVAFTGSIPVQVDTPGFVGRWARWVTIGADSTSVYAYEYGRLPSGPSYNHPAMSLDITVWVTDEFL